MTDKYDVTVTAATLTNSPLSGLPVVTLEFSPRGLCFVDDKVVGSFLCAVSNIHPAAGSKRAWLRVALGMAGSAVPFTDEELRSVIGRHLRVGVETIEFQGRLHRRVSDFWRCSGAAKNLSFSDNEYVFMMRELFRGGR